MALKFLGVLEKWGEYSISCWGLDYTHGVYNIYITYVYIYRAGNYYNDVFQGMRAVLLAMAGFKEMHANQPINQI